MTPTMAGRRLLSPRRWQAAAVFAFSTLTCFSLETQSFSVTPQAVEFKQPQGGPVPWPQQIAIGSESGNWTASFASNDGEPWLVVEPAKGMAPSTVTLSIVRWRSESKTPNTYSGTLSISARGSTRTVKVTWNVVPAAPDPRFTYIAPPRDCTHAVGNGPRYPDAAICGPTGTTAPATGQSYVDANFGATVKILTGPGVYHTYSTPSPLSAGNKYLLTYLSNGTFDIVDPTTGNVLHNRVLANQSAFWDADKDETYYYFDGPKVMQVDVRTQRTTVVIGYLKERGFGSISRGGTGDTSKDNWISFWAPKETQLCALDINNRKTYCADYSNVAVPYGPIDFTLMSKGLDRQTGKRYVVLVPGNGAGIYSVNIAAERLDLAARPESAESDGDGVCDSGEKCMNPSHADTFEDGNGIQYLVYNEQTESPCEVSVATYQLSKGGSMMSPVETGGGKRKVMSLWRCPFPNTPVPEDHVGCAKKAPLCVVSTTIPKRAQNSPLPQFAHAGEIIVFRGNGDEVRRLARNRSEPFNEEKGESYWSQSRAAIASDGTIVVADSNFGQKNGQRIMLIQTGFGPSAR